VPHTYRLIREQWVPQPPEEAFAFFSRPENLQEITPGWLAFRIMRVDSPLHTGSLIEYRLRWHGIPMRWTSQITDWSPPHRFIDNQLYGPYAQWHHEHNFTADNGGTRIRDEVQYALPFGVVGRLAHWLRARRDVEAIFEFRRERLKEMLGAK
jgi:ligand-binding SRPBCC domain-containing protein